MDLRGSLCFHLHKVKQNICRYISSLMTKIIAWMKGISIGTDFQASGIPYLYRTPHSSITIGNSCTIHSSFKSNNIGSMCRSRICTMTPEAKIDIANHVGMSAVTITAHRFISIGEHTQIGAGTVIIDSDFHNVMTTDVVKRHKEIGETESVIIGRNVFIGTRCIILKGVTIGDNAVIGAGSIVTKDIPGGAVVAGNPAHIIRQ